MYRLLIVDDLPIIVDGLFELFEQTEHLKMDILKAYSGEGALEVLEKHQIDIVISDIKMPGLEGIGLLQNIKARWPKCKVIFLTGYNDFHYVQSAIKYGGFEYILKIESDEKIIASVERAIEELNEENEQREMIEKANERMRRAMPSLQREYIGAILQGKQVTDAQLIRHFQDISIPMQAHLPVMLLLGRVDTWKDMLTQPDKALFIYAVQNIAEELLADDVRVYSYVYDQGKIVWFIQPGTDSLIHTEPNSHDWRKTYVEVSGRLERIQLACRRLLHLSVSFVLSSEPVAWNDVSDRYHMLKYNFIHGLGLSSEVILTDSDIQNSETACNHQREYFYLNRVQLLGKCLENNHRGEFFNIYHDLTKLWNDENFPNERKKELYHSLSAVFLAYINKSAELKEYLNNEHDLSPLFQYGEPDSWVILKEYFCEIAVSLFDWIAEQGELLPTELVQKAHRYIETHISTDISLNAIADHVGLNPSYFSRLYKQMTGTGISDYINDYRNLKAKELLLGSSMKVNEIALSLGYNSALAFIRFFKKQNDTTPQEYRSRGRSEKSKAPKSINVYESK